MNREDGLKKIYLIKSAGYEYQELDIESNTLLLGESGVGKTTIMRAVLFFYTMNYSDTMLNINPDTKKSFNDWYFKEHNSHLVYEYTRGESRFLFIVSKSGKLHYSFVDITNSSLRVKNLFLEGDMPLNLEKLNEKIQNNNLPNYYTSKREKYINTFHVRDSENRKIKQDASTNFTLFESISSRHEFAKTLSNIFASSKVSSLSLKKSIVSLINDSQTSINLNTIKTNLYEFISEKNEIEKFEKKIPTIEELAEVHISYKESKKEFKTLANILETFKQNIAIEKEKNRVNMEALNSQKEQSSLEYKVASKALKNEIQTAQNQLSITHAKIEELKEKELFYTNKKIEQLLENHEKEQSFQNSLSSATQRYEALTQGTQTLKLQYQELQNRLTQESQKMLNDLKILQSQEEGKLNQQINETIRSKEPRIQSALKRFVDEQKSHQAVLEKEKTQYNSIKNSLAKIEYFPFNKEQIQAYEKEIERFEKESTKITLLSAENTHKITMIEKEIEKISQDLKQESAQLDEKTAHAKELLFKQKAQIEQRLNFESENLYGFLNKNNIKNREKIVTYLKDEILFSEKKHTITQVVHDSAVFGLEIEFEEEFTNEYQQVKLLEELNLIKEKIKESNKKAAKQKRDLQEQAQQQSKEKNRQRTLFYSQKEEFNEQSIAYKKSSELAKENLNFAKIKAKEQKKESEEKLQKELANLELTIRTLNSQIQNLQEKIQTTTDAITKNIDESIVSLQEQIAKSQQSTQEKIQTAQTHYQERSEALQEELRAALEKEGVDERLLAEISQEIQSLKAQLQDIEKNRTLVTVYLDQFQEKIQKLPQDIKNYEENKTLHKNLNEALTLLEKKETIQLKEFEEQRKKLQNIKVDLEKFSQAYSHKIENQAIEQSIQNSLSPESTPPQIEINSEDLVDKVVSLYAKIKTDETKIESLVNNCRLVLKPNNIFKIAIENDYIDSISYLKTAKELIEYVKNDKISIHKELSSEMFKTALNSIKKDLALFEDAMLDIDSEVINLRNVIRKAVNSFNVIDAIKIRFEKSNHEILNMLQSLSDFYDEHNEKFLSGLFSSQINDTQVQNMQERLIGKISDLAELLKSSKEFIMLEDGFVLEFKVVENGNDLKWRQTLNDIGSNGTSTLVKSIINISMLQMVSKNITKEANIVSHCILDEIGTISTDYFKELKDFVNRSGFVFLNGMPIEDDMLISMYPTIYVGQKHSNYSRMILASTLEI